MMMMMLVPQSKLLHKAGAILLLSVMMNEFLIQCLIFSRLRSIAASKRRVWYAFGTLMNPQNLRGKCARTKLKVIEF